MKVGMRGRGRGLVGALFSQMHWALWTYWAWGLVAEMKLLPVLAGLLAVLAVPQSFEGASPGNGAERREKGVFGVVLSLQDLAQATLALGPIPDFVTPFLGSCPGGGRDFSGTDLHGGSQATSRHGLQGAAGEVGCRALPSSGHGCPRSFREAT